MEITYNKDSSFKIKTKLTTLMIDFSSKISFSDTDKVITGAGEYEIKGVSVLGFQIENKSAFVIEADKLRIGYIVGMEKDLTSNLIDDFGSIDILITDKHSIISDIEPYFVIPFRADDSEMFSKETGYQMESLPKLSVKKDEIIEDQNTKIILLEAK